MVTALTQWWPADWPEAGEVQALKDGEAWVSKDLQLLDHPDHEWIQGEFAGPRPYLSRDLMVVSPGSARRVRMFRRLDRDWLAWLARAMAKARPVMERDQPEVWAEISGRWSLLCAMATRWWGKNSVDLILAGRHRLDARYEAPRPRERLV